MPYGMRGFIGFAKESTYGTAAFAPGSCTNFLEGMSESVAVTIDRFESRNITGNIYEPDDNAGIRRIEGELAFAAHPVPLGAFLNSAFGTVVTSLIGGSLYRHTFTGATADASSVAPVPSYTLELNRDVTSSQLITGALVNELSMQFTPNQDVRVTANILGRVSSGSSAPSTATMPSSPTAPFTFDTASVSVGGVAVDIVEGLTISVNNNLEGIPTLNASTYIARARRTDFRQVRVSGTMELANISDYDRFLQQTEVAVSVHVTKASSFALTLDLPRVVYTAFPMGMPGKERLTVAFEGMARYHTGSLSSIRAQLVNMTTAY